MLREEYGYTCHININKVGWFVVDADHGNLLTKVHAQLLKHGAETVPCVTGAWLNIG